jgi:uncharacterized SAM-binding protein YcdF (DUF218 family)
MEFTLVNFFEHIFLPPGGLLLLAASGLIILRFRHRLGVILICASLGIFYVLSLWPVSDLLMRSLEKYPPLASDNLSTLRADAIVILAGGRLHNQPEYGGDTVSAVTLQRIRYGAWLKRRTNLPLYVSGGSTRKESKGEADLMRQVLQKEFNVEVNVVENKSKTTFENAKLTSELLKQNGHQKILLVSDSYHLPRAVEAFQSFGVEVIAAPTVFTEKYRFHNIFMEILPSSMAFEHSYEAFHEIFGRFWYKLRYY